MKCCKFAMLLMCLFYCCFAWAQYRRVSEPFDLTNLAKGQQFDWKLQNTSTRSVSFYVKTPFDNDTSHIFLNQEYFNQYIKDAGPSLLSQVKRGAAIFKSVQFRNNYLVYQDQGSLVLQARRYAASRFCLGASEEQCGNYVNFFVNVLISIGWPTDSIHIVNTPQHTVFEIVLNGKDVLVDIDPNEPLLLPTMPNGDYYSAQDIVHSGQYLFTKPVYRCVDQVTGYILQPCTWSSNYYSYTDSITERDSLVNRYIGLFQAGITYLTPVLFPACIAGGTYTIPPQGTLKWNWTVPFVLTKDETDTLKPLIQNAAATGNFLPAIHVAGVMLGINDSAAFEEFEKSDVVLNGGFSNPEDMVQSPIYEKSNMLRMDVSTQDLNLVIGNDVFAPGYITTVTTDAPLTLIDTVLLSGVDTFWIWNEKKQVQNDGFNNTTIKPTPALGEIETLDSGYISGYAHVSISLSYNQYMFDIPSGVVLDLFGADSNSIVVTQTFPQQPLSVTSTETVEKNLSVYPNPANSMVVVSFDYDARTIELFNSAGQLIESVPAKNNQKISLQNYATGTYFIKVGTRLKKIIKAN